ncbi:hypothetical protein Zmor_024660 [Zophobas morio]|uniref:CCHC-type domain-containing protein n=1 Tax=Zophobas morio TaxID=2755281 RepID=A0AA38M870_9CUCU|nr:hypothetical protein Zmor_024660 [Zophobas morio]
MKPLPFTSEANLSSNALKEIDMIVSSHVKPLLNIIEALQTSVNNLSKENSELRGEITKLNKYVNLTKAEEFTKSTDPEELDAKISYSNITKKNSQKTLIVKPKDDKQRSSKTKFDVMNNINPLTDINIGKVRTLRDGGILLKCENSSNFNQIAKDKLAEKYEVREVKSACPKIRISGIPNYIDDKDFLPYLRKQNEFLFDQKSVCNLLKFCPTKKNNSIFQALLEVDLSTYKRAISVGHCLVGLNGCTIYDAVDVTRCFNCNAFGHSSKFCKNSPSCPKCGNNHNLNECKEETVDFKCVNCNNLNIKNKNQNIDVEHAAWDYSKCHAHDLVLSKVKKDLFGLSA